MNKGFVTLSLVLVILGILAGISATGLFLFVGQERISRSQERSLQAHYAAEAGVEDAVLRVKNGMNWSSPYTLQIGAASAEVAISPMVGGVRTITAEGDHEGRIRKSQAFLRLDSTQVGFAYGVHAGDGGVTFGNGSQVNGNLFSNGSVSGSGTITGDVIVAQNGNVLQDATVGGNAQAYSCEDATVSGILTTHEGGSVVSCTAGDFQEQSDEISPEEFAITDEMITDWKADAESGGVVSGNVEITSNQSLGPVKIEGDLSISNNRILTLTGTVWVTGSFQPGNGSEVRLDASYQELSGVLIMDGQVSISNNVILEGSGSADSYVAIIGTASGSSAMQVSNNAEGAVLFAPNGEMALSNGVQLLEASAHSLVLGNNAEVTYETGLANVNFTSGPSAGWALTRWKEVE